LTTRNDRSDRHWEVWCRKGGASIYSYNSLIVFDFVLMNFGILERWRVNIELLVEQKGIVFDLTRCELTWWQCLFIH
jgi:hypothetical protein